MKIEDTVLAKKELLGNAAELHVSIDHENALSLADPITQIAKRIEGFFKGDPDIMCRFLVDNSQSIGPKIDPDTGEQMEKLMDVGGEPTYVLLENDHLAEFRVFCRDYEKAEALSNVIRHRHNFTEIFEGTDQRFHLRNHVLIVHVLTLDAIVPTQTGGGGTNPDTVEDDQKTGIEELYGLEPIDWNDPENSGCVDRLSPLATEESTTPKGWPEEWEQLAWEDDPSHAGAWKWKWLKKALKGNKNIKNMSFEFNDGMNTWRFIECGYLPVVFREDNLTSVYGFNSILPADLLPLIFPVKGGFQVGTYARKES